MKKSLMIVIMMTMSLFICVGLSAQTTLTAPVNLQINDGILTWDAVENANRYVVWSDSPFGQFMVNNITAPAYSLPSHIPNGALLRVRARIDVLGQPAGQSAWSEPIWNGPPMIMLDTPTNLRVVDNVLIWDSVENADRYQLTRNGLNVPDVVGNSHTLGTLHTGTHVFRVRAIGDIITYGLSEWSESYSHLVGPPPDFNPMPAENLSATVQQNTVTLTWDAPIWEHTGDIAFYVIYINGVMGGGGVIFPLTELTSLQFHNMQNGEYSFYVLTAYSIDGNIRLSGPSNIDNAVVFTVSDTDEVAPLSKTALLENFPNPFNPETEIRFTVGNVSMGTSTLPEGTSHVKIDIYNVRGQKVRNLIDADMSKGEHSVVWNGKDDNGVNVGSGVYFYMMTAGEYQSVRRMVLMK